MDVKQSIGGRIEPAGPLLPAETCRQLQELVTRRRRLIAMRSAEEARLRQAREKRLAQSIKRTIAFLSKQIHSLRVNT